MRRFKPGQLWETASGHVAQIICTNYGNPDYLILAIVTHSTKWETAETFTRDGLHNIGGDKSKPYLVRQIKLANVPTGWELNLAKRKYELATRQANEIEAEFTDCPTRHQARRRKEYALAAAYQHEMKVDYLAAYVARLKRFKP